MGHGDTVVRSDVVSSVSRGGAVVGGPFAILPGLRFITTQSLALLVPFGRRPTYRLGTDGLVYSGWNDTIEIKRTDIGGRGRGAIRHDHPEIKVTISNLNDYVSGMSDRSKQVILDAHIPKTMPAYRTFVPDDRGRVWVQIVGEGGIPTGTWIVLNAAGSLVAEAVVPADVNLQVITEDRAYGMGKNVRGAPYLVAYQFVGE